MFYDVKFRRLHTLAKIPERKTDGSAGLDLYTIEDVWLNPSQRYRIPLGFATEFSPEIHFRIESRSGLAFAGLVVLTGVIDSDYRGEWMVIMQNTSTIPQTVAAGERIAQAVARPTLPTRFEEVDSLLDTSRGAGGFGSTGR